MLFRYIFISLLLLMSIGVYLYFYILRTMRFWNIIRNNRKFNIAAALLSFVASILTVNIFGVGALVILHIFGAALCMEIINIVFKTLHKYKNFRSGVWDKIYCSGIIPVIVTALILSFGYYNMENVRETDYTINTEKIIRQQGYRIAMISDLHFGTTMNEDKLKGYCSAIEGKNPDIVVLCGDIVDQRTTLSQMSNALQILGNIKSSNGIYYVFGNHDKSSYSSNRAFNEVQLRSELSKNGIKVLEDEKININEEFTIIGRKDKGFSSEQKRKTTEELLSNISPQRFLLLLDHQPSELRQNSAVGIDLQLSGHTHGGQIWPAGFLNRVFGVGELNYGYKIIDKSQFIVSSGIAGWGYPIRTGSKSEFVIIDVQHRQ